MRVTDDQVLALAGCAQAAGWVHDLATHGNAPSDRIEQALDAILAFEPETTKDAVGPCQQGARWLVQQLSPGKNKPMEIGRYIGSLIALQDQLRKRQDVTDELGARLRQLVRKKSTLGLEQEALTQDVSDIYLDTISTLRMRIQVTGQAKWLSQSTNQAKIRVLLLYGIRCAWLWRQTGGRKWHFLFARNALVQRASRLQNSFETT